MSDREPRGARLPVWPPAGRILVWVSLFASYAVNYFFFLDHHSSMWLEDFTGAFRRVALLLALLLFVLSQQASQRLSSLAADVPTNPTLRYAWAGGLACMFAVVLGMFIYVNPHARFSGERFPTIAPFGRMVKIARYQDLKAPPEIVIFGSSRAFTLSPAYLEEKTGLSAFNMSVEAATPDDYAAQMQLLLDQDQPPDVVLIEISVETLRSSAPLESNPQPAALLPHIPPQIAGRVADEALREIFSLQALSDSVFVLAPPGGAQPEPMWSFEADGVARRNLAIPERYEAHLRAGFEDRIDELECRTLSSTAMAGLEKVFTSTLEQHVGIVVYRSPLSQDFLDLTDTDPRRSRIVRCEKLVQAYLASLPLAYPNVFVRDLMRYRPVTELRQDGYYDMGHLKPEAAESVIDALLPEIRSALAWTAEP